MIAESRKLFFFLFSSVWLIPVQGGSNIRLVEAVVERLLTSAVADMAVPVRRTVLESMKQMSDLDSYLAQADWYAQTDSASLDHGCDAHQAELLLEEPLKHGRLVSQCCRSCCLDCCCGAQ